MGEVQSKIPVTESYLKVHNTRTDRNLRTFPDVIKHFASSQPDRDAFVFASSGDTRETVTWKELYDRTRAIARSLVDIGVKKGEIVGLNLRVCPEWLYLAFGAMQAGAIAVGINFTYTDGSDLIALIKKLEKCSVLVMDTGKDGANWEVVKKLIDDLHSGGRMKSKAMPSLRYIVFHKAEDVVGQEQLSVTKLLTRDTVAELPESLSETDIVFLLQTSGSTDIPKLAAHTHKSLLALRLTEFERTNSKDDIVFNDRPFGWMGGFTHGLTFGQTRVTVSGFCDQPEDHLAFIADVIKREKCNVVQILPQYVSELISRKELLKGWKLKTIATSGFPIMHHLSECTDTLCRYFIAAYGATEGAPFTSFVVENSKQFIEYAGGTPPRGSSIEIKIVNKKEEIVPLNENGEVYVRGECMFLGYLNDPGKTRSVLTADGWYKTDDIGKINEDGVLIVQGRKSSMIISGGMNVAPEILEIAIKRCEAIEAVVVVPVSHPVLYQVVCACVIPKAGYDVTDEYLREYCDKIHNDRPREFTVLPKYYLFMEKFPVTSTGKVSRMMLKDIAEEHSGLRMEKENNADYRI